MADLDPACVRASLLAWYDAHARVLPWRTPPGSAARPDAYAVWLSEVMLQQTTTAHAAPYWRAFLDQWPTVGDLAAAEDGAVMAAWAGLGYYARARNLLACARAVVGDHGGVFPDTEEGLRALPGLGAYTAAAVAAIAFGRPANVVDGNVERVVSRLFAVETPLPAARSELRRLAGTLVADDRPADWPQALMDLGATVCRPRAPLCLVCPIRIDCTAYASGQPERYPLKAPKAERPRRFGTAWVLRDAEGRVALIRRPPKGLLGGMLALPTNDWTAAETLAAPPLAADWTDAGAVEHVFTHFALTLSVQTATVSRGSKPDLLWTAPAVAADSLPTVFAKALARGLATAE